MVADSVPIRVRGATTMIESLSPDGLLLVTHQVLHDQRGTFLETYRREELKAAGIDVDFVQDNQSTSSAAGTVRGLHYQRPPTAQDKFVRVIQGAILDVAVDLRRGSSTFGRHAAVRLSADRQQSFFVPKGFAHGFVTLEPVTIVAYKVSAPYSPSDEGGIIWNDPDLAIDWGLSPETVIVSPKDRDLPFFKDIDTPF